MYSRLAGLAKRAGLAGVAVLALASSADAQEHLLIPGQSATGLVETVDEEDEVRFFALAGTRVSFTLRAARGEPLRPFFTRLEAPGLGDRLPDAVVRGNRRRTVSRIIRFRCTETGTYVLGISGGSGTTGRYLLNSAPRPQATLLSDAGASIDEPDQRNVHVFDADAGSVVALVAARPRRSRLRPVITSISGPSGVLDLEDAVRPRPTRARDVVRRLLLPENGTYRIEVSGRLETTGAYRLLLRPARLPRLDFDVDPAGPSAPLVASVSPTEFDVPSTGNTMTVQGSHFAAGAAASFTPAGGITDVQTAFVSENELSVTFRVDAGAAPGTRSVTVTNTDARSGTLPAAVELRATGSAPVIAGVMPASGPAAGGTRVAIVGSGFTTAAPTVTFGGLEADAIAVIDANHIVCSVPIAASASHSASTAVDVTVDLGASGSDTLPAGYAYEADPVRPVVVATVPAGGATGVATNLQKIVVVLSEPVDATTLAPANFAFFRSGASGPNDIPGSGVTAVALGPSGRTLVLTRAPVNAFGNNFPNLSTGSAYLTWTPDQVTDVAGNALDVRPFAGGFYQNSFTTGAATDATAPAVAATAPATAAVGVAVDTVVTVTFSEPVDPVTVAAGVTLTQGATVVPSNVSLDATATTATLTPRHLLAPNTTYTIRASTVVTDLAGLTLPAAFASSFSTNASDGVAPTAQITVNDVPADMNGSTTYVPGMFGGAAATPAAFDVVTPQDAFTLDLTLNDLGGSGIDLSTLSVTCDRALGPLGPGTDFANLFSATPLRATFTVPAANAAAAGANMTFTLNVSDVAGNAAPTTTLTVDVADRTQTISNAPGTPATDRDPFNTRQTWLLRFDLDVYGITPVDAGAGVIRVDTTGGSNGTADFEEDLRVLGLNGNETGAAATVTNGADTGANAIVQRLVRDALRGYLRERFGITLDGVRDADSVEIEFLLPGESGSLASVPDPTQWNSNAGYSILSVTGDERPNANTTTLGRATVDPRNTGDENESNAGSTGTNHGVFASNMARRRLNDPSGVLSRQTFDPLISIASRGGTPVGEDPLDGTVLAGTFDYGSATVAQQGRYDTILLAVDRWALYLSLVAAHEIGHALGLVPDGPPPTGLFGNAHGNNSFIVTGGQTSSGHIDTPGDNVMEAAASFDAAVATGSAFVRFGPLNRAYLLRRLLYDQ